MSLLKVFVESPLAGTIGWTLLHSLWQGAILSGALAVVLAAVRSARVRYASACAAMVLMLGAFSVTLATLMPEQTQVPLHGGATGVQTATVVTGNDSGSASPSLAPLVPWLTPFWITGVLLIYLRRVESCISVQKLRRRGVCNAPEHWQERLSQLSNQLRVWRPIQLLESSLADVPTVLGHFRPLILVPAGLFAGLPSWQIEAILLHELAHVRRHDYLLNMLQRLAEGLFFYHPAVWWISRVMRVERENCCDDLAVSVVGDSYKYASALAALEQRRHTAVEPALAATGGSLMKRIRRVLYPKTSNAPWAPFLAAAMFIIIAAVSLAAWEAESPRDGSGDVQWQNQGEAGSAYSKWLIEDVVYIIDDEERSAFLKLSTDEEREKFIEQFWQRRDPSPGTPTNEFKQEHYRRIAYSNAHFGTTSGTPGWQTDRGRIYIVYGRADEIEVHPSGRQGMYGSRPFEVWIYKNASGNGNSGSFTFVDQTGRGDFRLAPGNPQVGRTGTELKTPSPAEKGTGRGTADQAAAVPHVRVPEDAMVPLVQDKVPPVYPEVARQARIQGTVVLQAVIGRDGLVQNLHVVSGHPMLAPAAMEAVRQWRYKPYLVNGSPVEVETMVRITFSLGQ